LVGGDHLMALRIEGLRLVAVITTTGTDPVALGIAAGLGQTAGKLLTFLAARRSSLRCRPR
jgi:hypothetical protein